MNNRRPLRGLPTVGMAAAGVVLGHWMAYLLAVPKPQVRIGLLERSGHGYWLFAMQVAIALGVVALGSVVLSHVRSARNASGDAEEPYSRVAFRLAALQVAAFTAMEIGERILAGSPVGAMFHHQVFLLGLAVQLMVASAGALILFWFSRAALRVVRALLGSSRPRPLSIVVWFELPAPKRPLVLAGAAGLRGPPSP